LLFTFILKPYITFSFAWCIFYKPLFPLRIKAFYGIVQLGLREIIGLYGAGKIFYMLGEGFLRMLG
jgi:hypothetical protein